VESSSPQKPFLDPELAAQLESLEFRARRVVEGAFAGRYRSKRSGHSAEFSGHRSYTPSDDWRRIDWKVFGRTDHWMIREDRDETNLRVHLLLDVSRSMAFAGQNRPGKLEYAKVFTAALAMLMIHQKESVGLTLFSDRIRHFMPDGAGASQLARLLEGLAAVTAGGGPSDFRRAVRELGERLRRRSVIVLISDLYRQPDDILESLRFLTARKHEVMAVQVIDPDERTLPFEGAIRLTDMESGETVRTEISGIQKKYRDIVDRWLETNFRSYSSAGIDYTLVETSVPLAANLRNFLDRRRPGGAGTPSVR